MFRQGYEIFARNLEELEEGKEIEREIRDTETYQTKLVRAIFSSQKPASAQETVWIRALVGHLLDENPWKIKIVKVVEER